MKMPFTVKETLIEWRRLRVVTAQWSDPNLLRHYSVFVVDGAGSPKSRTAGFATAAAADIEHQRLVRQLTTGEKEFSVKRKQKRATFRRGGGGCPPGASPRLPRIMMVPSKFDPRAFVEGLRARIVEDKARAAREGSAGQVDDDEAATKHGSRAAAKRCDREDQ